MTEGQSSSGELVYDERVTLVLVVALAILSGLAFYSASLQDGAERSTSFIVGVLIAGVGLFVVRAREKVQMRWDAQGLEAPGKWWSPGDGTAMRPGVIRIAWSQVSWLGPDADLNVIDGSAGQRIAVDIIFCRGRMRLLSEMRKRRPDLFGTPD